ncbi:MULTISPECIES: hypothetical protein [Nocardia]|jgi:Mce-associated membrane protein|nr:MULTISPECIES: hypothetical protein [Nocardia]MCZ9330076.1 hypothetical protein [Nocardia farcinica]RBO78540.1 hypothetical protein DFR74_1399 [Nocardia puris]UEX22283.1 hypothetical protein LMJ57_25490 [Nocardia farcinica]VFA96376.1 Uncharacterised protein [Nocardia cyriacigeorgica]
MPTEDSHDTDREAAEEKPVDAGVPRTSVKGGSSARGSERSFSISLRSLALGTAVALLVVAVAVSIPLWLSARSELKDRDAVVAAEKRAEEVASEYAVGASNIDYQNFDQWVRGLKSNVSPVLANKFDATAPQLKEIVLPLKWSSSGVPIAATVRSERSGVYVVNVFLNVTSKSAQIPEGAQTTVTYTVTVDKNLDWKVTDVGGVDSALPAK